jgi:hypothetical protein
MSCLHEEARNEGLLDEFIVDGIVRWCSIEWDLEFPQYDSELFSDVISSLKLYIYYIYKYLYLKTASVKEVLVAPIVILLMSLILIEYIK